MELNFNKHHCFEGLKVYPESFACSFSVFMCSLDSCSISYWSELHNGPSRGKAVVFCINAFWCPACLSFLYSGHDLSLAVSIPFHHLDWERLRGCLYLNNAIKFFLVNLSLSLSLSLTFIVILLTWDLIFLLHFVYIQHSKLVFEVVMTNFVMHIVLDAVLSVLF